VWFLGEAQRRGLLSAPLRLQQEDDHHA
jgi:hypothetical protein